MRHGASHLVPSPQLQRRAGESTLAVAPSAARLNRPRRGRRETRSLGVSRLPFLPSVSLRSPRDISGVLHILRSPRPVVKRALSVLNSVIHSPCFLASREARTVVPTGSPRTGAGFVSVRDQASHLVEVQGVYQEVLAEGALDMSHKSRYTPAGTEPDVILAALAQMDADLGRQLDRLPDRGRGLRCGFHPTRSFALRAAGFARAPQGISRADWMAELGAVRATPELPICAHRSRLRGQHEP